MLSNLQFQPCKGPSQEVYHWAIQQGGLQFLANWWIWSIPYFPATKNKETSHPATDAQQSPFSPAAWQQAKPWSALPSKDLVVSLAVRWRLEMDHDSMTKNDRINMNKQYQLQYIMGDDYSGPLFKMNNLLLNKGTAVVHILWEQPNRPLLSILWMSCRETLFPYPTTLIV